MSTTRRGFLGAVAALFGAAKLAPRAKALPTYEHFVYRPRAAPLTLPPPEKTWPPHEAYMQNASGSLMRRGDLASIDLREIPEDGVFERVDRYAPEFTLHLIAMEDVPASKYGRFLVQGAFPCM